MLLQEKIQKGIKGQLVVPPREVEQYAKLRKKGTMVYPDEPGIGEGHLPFSLGMGSDLMGTGAVDDGNNRDDGGSR